MAPIILLVPPYVFPQILLLNPIITFAPKPVLITLQLPTIALQPTALGSIAQYEFTHILLFFPPRI